MKQWLIYFKEYTTCDDEPNPEQRTIYTAETKEEAIHDLINELGYMDIIDAHEV